MREAYIALLSSLDLPCTPHGINVNCSLHLPILRNRGHVIGVLRGWTDRLKISSAVSRDLWPWPWADPGCRLCKFGGDPVIACELVWIIARTDIGQTDTITQTASHSSRTQLKAGNCAVKSYQYRSKFTAAKPLLSLFGQFANCRPNPSAVVVS